MQRRHVRALSGEPVWSVSLTSRRARPPFVLLALALAACGAGPLVRETPPLVTQNTDGDADSVHDADDACPLDAEDLDGRHDDDGCPDVDDDSDAILDVDDLCPCDVEDRDAF